MNSNILLNNNVHSFDRKVCLKHRKATRIWKGISDENQSLQVCQCCGRKVGKEDLKTQCCYYSSQLSFLGVGVPLFFSFMRYSILLLIILSLVFCVFGLYTNIVSNSCNSDTSCQRNIFNTLSLINKKNQDNYMSIQNYILLAFVVITIFLFQFFRYRFRKMVIDIDEYVHSPSDYSLILKRLPAQANEDDIRMMVHDRRGYLTEQQKLSTNNLQIQKIVMSYDLSEWNQQRDKHLSEFKDTIKKGSQKQFKQPNLPRPTIPGYIAIIIFTKQDSKELFISKPSFFQRSLYYFFAPCSPLSEYQVCGEYISVDVAPEPDDIIWSNAHISIYQQIFRKIILGFLSIILLVAGGIAQYGLAILQKNIDFENVNILIGTAASVVVTITNLILQYYLIYSTMGDKMNTMTEYMDVLTFKLVILQFLNSGLFVVAANIAANYQTFNLQSSLSETITQIMLFNAITQSVSNFILYRFNITGRIMKYLCIDKKCLIYTQLQANQLYQLPQPEVPYKYSYIIKTLWLTSFYAPFCPIVVPISILGLGFNYTIQKILFGKSYSVPNNISSAVNTSSIEMLQFIPLILSIGEFIIYFYFEKFQFESIPKYWSIPIYVSIAISLINLLLPMDSLNEILCKLNPDLSQEPNYNEVVNEFEVTYEITNPAYQSLRPAMRDAKIWKKLFNHTPSLVSKQMKQKEYNNTLSSDRSYNQPLINRNKSSNSNNLNPYSTNKSYEFQSSQQNNNPSQPITNPFNYFNQKNNLNQAIQRNYNENHQNNSNYEYPNVQPYFGGNNNNNNNYYYGKNW